MTDTYSTDDQGLPSNTPTEAWRKTAEDISFYVDANKRIHVKSIIINDQVIDHREI